MKGKRLIASLSAAVMVVASMSMSVLAEATYTPVEGIPTEDGVYRVENTMYFNDKYDEGTKSMSDVMFAEHADLTISGDDATLSLYVIQEITMGGNPVVGANGEGTLKDVLFTIAGTDYTPQTVIEDSYPRNFSKESTAFGIVAGTTYDAQKFTVTLPKTALSQDYIDVEAFVNLFMMSTQQFDLGLANYEKMDGDVTDPEVPTTETREVPITATVAENQTTYSVTVPEAVTMGNLSMTEDTVTGFDVAVEINAGNDNKAVTIETATSGMIANADATAAIDFANSFGTQTTAQTATVSGALIVAAADVANAPIGDYTGTMQFAIGLVDAE